MSFSLLNNRISQKIVFLTAVTALVACDDFSLGGKKTTAATKTEQMQQENQAIDIFNKNVAIKVERSNVGIDSTKFTYTIKNRGKNNIKSVSWEPIHTYNGAKLYQVPIKVNFDDSLKPGDEYSFTTTYDLVVMQQDTKPLLPEAAKLLADPNAKIVTLILAKSIVFTNGNKLIVD